MGRLEKGKWVYGDLIANENGGEFKREEQKLRHKIAPGTEFAPEANRYHLYVSYACPWAHRTLIMRQLKGLEDVISVSVVSPYMLDDGWSFLPNFPGVIRDEVLGQTFLRQVYAEAVPEFTGRATVPVLFDKKTRTIVNTESADVIRILNSSFADFAGNDTDYYPSELWDEIDRWNADIYENVNNGVYKCGFASTQEAYDKNVKALFGCLDHIDQHLRGRQYLVGDQLTEADIRLYTTLVRFDPVYYVHFKCNRTMIREFAHLGPYLQRLFNEPAFHETTHFDHIKAHYYFSQKQINPHQIVPMGPDPLVVTASSESNFVLPAKGPSHDLFHN